MSFNLYQGDPKITLDQNGADIVWKSGQPVMDSGLENAVLIALFSAEDWFGNAYAQPSEAIGSKFYPETQKAITASQLGVIQAAAAADLKKLVDDGLIAEPEITVTNPRSNRLDVLIISRPPAEDAQAILLSRYGENWRIQTISPANQRV